MRSVGEICLLGTLVCSGFAAYVGVTPGLQSVRRVRFAAAAAGWLCLGLLTAAIAILAIALYRRDFAFDYVAANSSQSLPWYYSISSLWVGQAGSLLLWAWFLSVLTALFRCVNRDRGRASAKEKEWLIASDLASRTNLCAAPERALASQRSLLAPANGILMGYLCFLVAIMVFAANPMEANVLKSGGMGLSPLLQHPAMLIHPPVVFLGYALWTVPFALVIAALLTGEVDGGWIRQARMWSLAAWAVLGAGILLGAQWAYEELGWGGYWGWDPVENGSLIPWIAGTATIHALMVWQHRQALKKTAVALAIATFGLCNFATFLTRSGIFSSLHAFSQSPIGWLFLAFMAVLLASGGYLTFRQRAFLKAGKPLQAFFSRESIIIVAIVTLLLLLTAVLLGTLSSAISSSLAERMILVGPDFYNTVLIPVGLVLLLTMALAPLLRWGKDPSRRQVAWLGLGIAAGLCCGVFAVWARQQPPLLAVIVGIAALAVTSLLGAIALDLAPGTSPTRLSRIGSIFAVRRPMYGGLLVHMGFFCLALGVAASGLGSSEQDLILGEGETVDWSGRQVRFVELNERRESDKDVTEAKLEIATPSYTTMLLPARHFHLLTKTWTTEVAIDTTLWNDFYVILHGQDEQGRVRLTIIEKPMVYWLWLGGYIMAAGSLLRLWPSRRRRAETVSVAVDDAIGGTMATSLRKAAA